MTARADCAKIEETKGLNEMETTNNVIGVTLGLRDNDFSCFVVLNSETKSFSQMQVYPLNIAEQLAHVQELNRLLKPRKIVIDYCPQAGILQLYPMPIQLVKVTAKRKQVLLDKLSNAIMGKAINKLPQSAAFTIPFDNRFLDETISLALAWDSVINSGIRLDFT